MIAQSACLQPVKPLEEIEPLPDVMIFRKYNRVDFLMSIDGICGVNGGIRMQTRKANSTENRYPPVNWVVLGFMVGLVGLDGKKQITTKILVSVSLNTQY
jgi:hypothetical protein